MSEKEKLMWYNIVTDIYEEESWDDNDDAFYWADSIYQNMKPQTMLLFV